MQSAFRVVRNDYLEQKKKAFPRFYFVANGALLDILSNGNKPLKALEEKIKRVLKSICTLSIHMSFSEWSLPKAKRINVSWHKNITYCNRLFLSVPMSNFFTSHCFFPFPGEVAEYLGDVFDGIRPTLRDAEKNSMLLWLVWIMWSRTWNGSRGSWFTKDSVSIFGYRYRRQSRCMSPREWEAELSKRTGGIWQFALLLKRLK